MTELDRNVRAALRRELQKAEEDRTRLDVVISYLRERLGEGEQAPAVSPVRRTPMETERAPSGRKRLKRLTAAAAAHQVLTQRGRPTRTPELLPEVQQLGASIKDVDGLYRAMTRDPRFIKVGRGLWGLKAWEKASVPRLDLGLGDPPQRSGAL